MIRIVPLAETPESLPVLVRWFIEEWAPYYGTGGPGDAERDLTECCNRDTLPIALVALDADGYAVGTAALKRESVGGDPGQTPWLAAFLVGVAHRGQGIGTLLVAAIEKEARRLGFTAVYTSTDAAEGIVKKRGWEPLAQATSLRGPITIYKLELARA
ncbi:MAG: GNAT family N-acetyltransferase [Methyloligellaceae bacterium]